MFGWKKNKKNKEDMENIADVIVPEEHPAKKTINTVPEPKQAIKTPIVDDPEEEQKQLGNEPVKAETCDLEDDPIADFPITRSPELMEACRQWRDSLSNWYNKNGGLNAR